MKNNAERTRMANQKENNICEIQRTKQMSAQLRILNFYDKLLAMVFLSQGERLEYDVRDLTFTPGYPKSQDVYGKFRRDRILNNLFMKLKIGWHLLLFSILQVIQSAVDVLSTFQTKEVEDSESWKDTLLNQEQAAAVIGKLVSIILQVVCLRYLHQIFGRNKNGTLILISPLLTFAFYVSFLILSASCQLDKKGPDTNYQPVFFFTIAIVSAHGWSNSLGQAVAHLISLLVCLISTLLLRHQNILQHEQNEDPTVQKIYWASLVLEVIIVTKMAILPVTMMFKENALINQITKVLQNGQAKAQRDTLFHKMGQSSLIFEFEDDQDHFESMSSSSGEGNNISEDVKIRILDVSEHFAIPKLIKEATDIPESALMDGKVELDAGIKLGEEVFYLEIFKPYQISNLTQFYFDQDSGSKYSIASILRLLNDTIKQNGGSKSMKLYFTVNRSSCTAAGNESSKPSGRQGLKRPSLFRLPTRRRESQKAQSATGCDPRTSKTSDNGNENSYYEFKIVNLIKESPKSKAQYLLKINNITSIVKSQQRICDNIYQELIEANYSHEQMTPLNCILQNSKILKQRIRGLICQVEDQSFDGTSIETQNNNNTLALLEAVEFSGQILQLHNKNQICRMQIRKGEFESKKTKAISIEHTIKQVIVPFSTQIKSKKLNVQILRRTSFDLEEYQADWKNFQLCIFNLIQNAVKYNTYKGDILIIIGLEENGCDEANKVHKLDIEIIDSGLGIEVDRQSYLFVPFKELKAKQDIKQLRHNSMGLGLACAKDIIQQLDGDIYLKHSERGLTVFKIQIPVSGSVKPQRMSQCFIEKPTQDVCFSFCHPVSDKLCNYTQKSIYDVYSFINLYESELKELTGYNDEIKLPQVLLSSRSNLKSPSGTSSVISRRGLLKQDTFKRKSRFKRESDNKIIDSKNNQASSFKIPKKKKILPSMEMSSSDSNISPESCAVNTRIIQPFKLNLQPAIQKKTIPLYDDEKKKENIIHQLLGMERPLNSSSDSNSSVSGADIQLNGFFNSSEISQEIEERAKEVELKKVRSSMRISNLSNLPPDSSAHRNQDKYIPFSPKSEARRCTYRDQKRELQLSSYQPKQKRAGSSRGKERVLLNDQTSNISSKMSQLIQNFNILSKSCLDMNQKLQTVQAKMKLEIQNPAMKQKSEESKVYSVEHISEVEEDASGSQLRGIQAHDNASFAIKDHKKTASFKMARPDIFRQGIAGVNKDSSKSVDKVSEDQSESSSSGARPTPLFRLNSGFTKQTSTFQQYFQKRKLTNNSLAQNSSQFSDDSGSQDKCLCQPKILLVDDNEFNLLPLSTLIESLFGIQTHSAHNGLQALEIFQEQLDEPCKCPNRAFKFIFMDLQMPEMDGFEASEKILAACREAGEPDHTHIVALTAYTSKETRERVLKIGLKDLINKPLHHKTLQKMVQLHFFRLSEEQLAQEFPQLLERKDE